MLEAVWKLHPPVPVIPGVRRDWGTVCSQQLALGVAGRGGSFTQGWVGRAGQGSFQQEVEAGAGAGIGLLLMG